MSGIFISYRREDTGGEAAHLRDDLIERFGESQVFLDHGGIVPGSDWRRRIFDAIDSSNVVLVLIGPHWATLTGSDGARRLEEPDDFLREEIARALTRGVPVIPVLVNNAGMPAALPPEIRQLAHLQAALLRNPDWSNDLARLVERLRHFAPLPSPVLSETAAIGRLVKWPFMVVLVIFLVIFAAAVAFIVATARSVLGG